MLRLLYTSQLDPLTLAIQDEIDKNSGLDSDHYGIKKANATPQTLEWPDTIIYFVNYLESIGGQASCTYLPTLPASPASKLLENL